MRNQDNVYLDTEADDIFKRNKYDFGFLPESKKELINNFVSILVRQEITNILEIGCHIGDLLNYCVKTFDAEKGYGVEPSIEAVEEGKRRFSKKCELIRGVASQDDLFTKIPSCDLVIVNDVFCWMSRASVFRSIANIDEHVSDNGYLLIRDFLPVRFIRNRNRHVKSHDVFCHKIIGSHAEIFKQTGNYQVVSSRVFCDTNLDLTKTTDYNVTENRWIDILLQKRWE